MIQIAVIGPGAIGGAVAVRLMQVADNTVLVCVRTPITQLTLETDGSVIVAVPEVLVTPDQGRPVDWILVATKAYDAQSSATWLHRLMGPNTRVAVLQNGVEHVERFAPYVAESRIVPVIVDMPVERDAPGYFRQRRSGHFTVAAGAEGEDFAQLFRDSGIEVAIEADFLTAAWRKLARNCAGAVSALILKPASISHKEAAAEVMRDLVRECIAVGRAVGANLDEALVETVIDIYRNSAPDSVNSLHADRAAGRPMEIDARNGVIVRLGREHGIDTPVNRTIVALLEAVA